MRWRDVLVASWSVDPAAVERRLPEGLDVDTYDGRAWLSAVPFVMAAVRPSGLPARIGFTFGELNLRTYVTREGERGIYFFNLDANDRIGVAFARTLFKLPYYSASMHVERTGDSVEFESERTHRGATDLEFDASYGPTEPTSEAEPGSLEAFLLERYRFYADGRNSLYRGDVDHDPWPLATAEATFRRNDLFAANDFDEPDGSPHLLYSPGVDVTASWIRRV